MPKASKLYKNKILLLENVHPNASSVFEREDFNVEILDHSLDESELLKSIENVTVLGIRSKTIITRKLLQEAEHLVAVGAYCIGTNQIDLKSCSDRGIVVFNAPYSNTRSVVELVVGEIIMLIRGIFNKCQKLHDGIWHKSATGNHELRGKRLGIIGYGNIGSQLSVLAEALGLDVYFYDIVDKLALGNAKKCDSLSELLSLADIVTVHVDGRRENRMLIGEKEFRQMRDGVIFLNLSRGFVVDLAALAEFVRIRKISGAAIDVFPSEPRQNHKSFISDLQHLPNVILTPHIGGSTEEAQRNIADFVSRKIVDFLKHGSTMLSVNFPNLQLPEIQDGHRLVHIHRNIPGILAKINHILAVHEINIEGQYLKTNDHIGYVITDISRQYGQDVIRDISQISGTIRVRILY